jgi:hypothetical protein
MGTNLGTMTKRKTKKRFDPVFVSFRHPRSPFSHLTVVRITVALVAALSLGGAMCVFTPSAGADNKNGSHKPIFVIFTTVFTEQGFALTGARVRVRQADQKKFKWEGFADRQGEVAFRVPPGAEYEMMVEAKGFKPDTRKIDAREENQADLTIRMAPLSAPHAEPAAGGKP